jgi:hypothetical protein
MKFLAQRYDRAAERWAHAVVCSLKCREMTRASTWLVYSSRLALDRPHRAHIAGGSGDEHALRERIRRAIVEGSLPVLDDNRSWAGRGSGKACHVCGERIRPAQVEHEVEVPEPVVVHHACLAMWREISSRAPAARADMPTCTLCRKRITPASPRCAVNGEPYHMACWDRIARQDPENNAR